MSSCSPRGHSGRRRWQAALGGLIAVMIVVGGSTLARADDEDEPLDEKIIKDILGGLGLDVGRQAGIDYHERSPLVIPPSRELPPPETTSSVANNPAWPVNPETRRQKKAVIDNRKDNWAYRKDQLPPSELDKGRQAGVNQVTKPDPNANLEPSRPLLPSQLGETVGSWFSFNSLFGYKQAEQAPFNGEPPRTNLTQPPSGYQVPSAEYPYGINPDNKRNVKIPNIMDRSAESSR